MPPSGAETPGATCHSEPSPRLLRRELALPNELIYKILMTVVSDSVHSICVSREDTAWEIGMMGILHQVSRTFKAIASEIVIKAFDITTIQRGRQTEQSLLRTIRGIFVYLSRLGVRLRHPSDWGSVSFQTIDCSASSFVFAYALYLSCISLRRNACQSPRDVFESTHKVILTALSQAEALCDRVFPVDMTTQLVKGVEEEFLLSRHGLTLVHTFAELDSYANSMAVLLRSRKTDGSDSLTAVYSMIHTALLQIEASHTSYTSALSNKNSIDPEVYKLPGVLPALQKIYCLQFTEEDTYHLRERIDALVASWMMWCPFLNQDSKITAVVIAE